MLIENIVKSYKNKFDWKGLITFINPYSYLLLRKNQELINSFNYVWFDGIVLIQILRLFGIGNFPRYSFDMTSMAPIVFEHAIDYNKSILFIGAKQIQIENFIHNVRILYPALNIVGFFNGYFKTEIEEKKTIDEILNKGPEIVICGMGTPKQEDFLFKLKELGWKGAGFTCGGFIHQTAKELNYYPKIFDKLNIRWIYRIIDEPKLVYRYFVLYPRAIAFFLIDLIKFKLIRK